jgi:hypothetical protein
MVPLHAFLPAALAALSSSSLGFVRFSEAAVLARTDAEPEKGLLRANSVSRSSFHPEKAWSHGAEHAEQEGHEIEHEGAEAEDAEHEAESDHSNTGFITVLGFGAAVILFALSFACANHSNPKIAFFTWRCLDNVISIFLAVLIFQALDEVVVDSGILPKQHIVIGSFIYALFLLTAAVGLSTLFKSDDKDNKDLAIFAASSAHFVGFGFMHASTIGIEHHASSIKHACYIFIGVCIFVPVMYVGLFYIKKHLGMYSDPELIEKVDDIETDAGAMAFSITWTLLVCFFITGEFTDIEEEDEAEKHERRVMLMYTVIVNIVGCIVILLLCDAESAAPENGGSYFKQRFSQFASSAIAMCMAWAWLVWGKWYFHEHSFAMYPMFSRIWFAFIMSLVAISVIVILGNCRFKPQRPDRAAQFEKEELLLILTVSLVAAWSWEEAFDNSLETISESPGSENLWHGAYKLIAGGIMLAVVLPVHVIYFKPLALQHEKEVVEDNKK